MSSTLILKQDTRQKTAEYLAQLLADTYVLYIKTQGFHWNVKDQRFYSLHKMFEKQYEELAEAVDVLAEQIRTLGITVAASMRGFLDKTSLYEAEGNLQGNAMLQQLAEDHTHIADHIRPKIKEIQEMGDEGSADLLIERLRYHEKTAWMLRSHFNNEG